MIAEVDKSDIYRQAEEPRKESMLKPWVRRQSEGRIPLSWEMGVFFLRPSTNYIKPTHYGGGSALLKVY